jgi:hypothetical protein
MTALLKHLSSLSATYLRNHIINAMRLDDTSAVRDASLKIGNTFVYAHPSIVSLAMGIVALLQPQDAEADERKMHIQAMQAMIDHFAADMPDIQAPSDLPAPTERVVLITGTTGGLGSQLLAQCLADEGTTRIYALNRPASATSVHRHVRTFRDRGLNTVLLKSAKLIYLEGDSSQNWLGLNHDVYDALRAQVTVIIHNAWRLDFNLALASFASHVRGTRNLLDLALTSPYARYMRFLFTSSISVTMSWPKSRGPVPEEPLESPAFAVGTGYGEGKYVAEQVSKINYII